MNKLIFCISLLLIQNVYSQSLEEQSNSQQQKKDLISQKGRLLKSQSTVYSCETNVGLVFYNNKVFFPSGKNPYELSDESYILFIELLQKNNKFISYKSEDKKILWRDSLSQYELNTEKNTMFFKLLNNSQGDYINKLKCVKLNYMN